MLLAEAAEISTLMASTSAAVAPRPWSSNGAQSRLPAVAHRSRFKGDHCRFRPGSQDPSRSDVRNRRQLGHLRSKTGRIALQHEQADLVEHLVDDLRGALSALGAQDLLGRRRLWSLVGVEELLVQL